jgi:hypothetical protein
VRCLNSTVTEPGAGERRDTAVGALLHHRSADYRQRWWRRLKLGMRVVGRAATSQDKGGRGGGWRHSKGTTSTTGRQA